MRVDSRNSGRPDRPPCSFARISSRSVLGRAIVVFDTIMPSTRRERATCTTSSSWARLRSGAILSSTGVAPAPSRTRSRASITLARGSSGSAPSRRLRRPRAAGGGREAGGEVAEGGKQVGAARGHRGADVRAIESGGGGGGGSAVDRRRAGGPRCGGARGGGGALRRGGDVEDRVDSQAHRG